MAALLIAIVPRPVTGGGPIAPPPAVTLPPAAGAALPAIGQWDDAAAWDDASNWKDS